MVHDRDQNYDAFTSVARQLRCAHILRDLADCAESYPDAIWPGQAADALRALIHAANEARAQGRDAVPGETTAADLRLFRSAIRGAAGCPPRARREGEAETRPGPAGMPARPRGRHPPLPV